MTFENYKHKHMKHTIFLLTIFSASLLITSSCKKGENDPSLPFTSRDARITAKWILKSSNTEIETTDFVGGTNYKIKTKKVFDGTTMKETVENGVDVEQFNYPYSFDLEIKKNGIYELSVTNDGVKTNKTNYWFWQNSDKNKTGINLAGQGIYMIDRLANKELTLIKHEITSVTQENGNISTTETNIQMVFEKE